jgi:hypothetical protein
MHLEGGQRMKVRTLAALALGATTLFSASSALAVEPAQLHEGASIAGLVGFGANAYGFDLGVRGGYTLPNHVYLGGTFIFNTGLGGWGAGFTTGFEGGYEFAAGPVVVRPYGGLGFVDENYNGYYGYAGNTYNAQLCAEGIDNAVYCNNGNGFGSTTTSFAFWVGGTAIYDFKGGPWFVAADIRMGDAPALFYQQFVFAFMPGGGYEF